MGSFLLYIVEIAVCFIVFYIFIKAFLSRDTFFKFNRFVILLGMVVCLILPAIKLDIPQPSVVQAPVRILETALEVQDNLKVDTTFHPEYYYNEYTAQPENRISLSYILLFIYLVGVIINLILLCRSMYCMIKLIKSGKKQKYKEYSLVIVQENINPFSWRKYIVISEKDYEESAEEILTHEVAHIQHKHSYDLIFTECLILFQWFNPAIWLLKRELKDVHEYQADMNVLRSGIDATRYQLLLVKKAVGASSYTLANSFNHSKIKKRITMMLKEKSNKWAKLKLMLLLPAITICMYTFAQPAVNNFMTAASIGENTNILPKDRISEEQVYQDSKTALDGKTNNSPPKETDPQKIMEAKVKKMMDKVQEMNAEFHKEIEISIKHKETLIRKLNEDLHKEMEAKLKEPDSDTEKEMQARVKVMEAKIQEIEAEIQKEIEAKSREMEDKINQMDAELQKELATILPQKK